MLQATFYKACDWLKDNRWEITSDGTRGYYLSYELGSIRMVYCTSKEKVIEFVENELLSNNFNRRNKLYVGYNHSVEGEKQHGINPKSNDGAQKAVD
jgi:hypothetical protein